MSSQGGNQPANKPATLSGITRDFDSFRALKELSENERYKNLAQQHRESLLALGKDEEYTEGKLSEFKDKCLENLKKGADLEKILDKYEEGINGLKQKAKEATTVSGEPTETPVAAQKAKTEESADERALRDLYSDGSIKEKMENMVSVLEKKGIEKSKAEEIKALSEKYLIGIIKNGESKKDAIKYLDAILQNADNDTDVVGVIGQLIDGLDSDDEELVDTRSGGSRRSGRPRRERFDAGEFMDNNPKMMSSESFKNTLEKFRRMINS